MTARLLWLPAVIALAMGPSPVSQSRSPDILPGPAAAKVLSVATSGRIGAAMVVLTTAVAIKETGPQKTVKAFGEVYAFSPPVFAVHRDVPTRVTFWNLQEDDEHDFMLLDPRDAVLMKVKLPALAKTSFVFTFHEEGIFPFFCTVHQPEMSGQILVLPPARPCGARVPEPTMHSQAAPARVLLAAILLVFIGAGGARAGAANVPA